MLKISDGQLSRFQDCRWAERRRRLAQEARAANRDLFRDVDEAALDSEIDRIVMLGRRFDIVADAHADRLIRHALAIGPSADVLADDPRAMRVLAAYHLGADHRLKLLETAGAEPPEMPEPERFNV